MINWYRFLLIFGLLSIFSLGVVSAQDAVKKRSRINLDYLKKFDKSEYLLANLKVRKDRYVPLEDATIYFFSISDTLEMQLGEMQTDANGDALFVIEDWDNVYKDADGFITFRVVYQGSDSIADESDEVMVKQANMDLSFFQKDSIKSIKVELYELGADDEAIPIEDVTVMFYVKGTFSLLTFGEETTDEEGIITLPFPVDMPGDTTGVLTIVTKIEESDDYGIIESQEPINWGTPIIIEKETHRGLGDTDAPLWMVYTLIILLSAVWFHYLYVIYLIVKIKMARRVFT